MYGHYQKLKMSDKPYLQLPILAPDTSVPPFSLLVSMNGSLASTDKSIGGGDLVLFKFIRLSQMQPDVLIPESAQNFAITSGKKILTRKNNGLSMLGIIGVFLLRIIQGIWQACRNEKVYDVALAASPFAVDVIPVWFWKARRKGAVIYHVIPERKPVNLLTRMRFGLATVEQKITLAILRRACDFIVAGNEMTRRELVVRLPGKPIFILPAGFDAGLIDRIPAQTKDPNLACFIGRMVSQKGIFDLLKVMAELARIRPGFQLIMVGTGPERDFFIAEMHRLKLTNIQLAGYISEEEKMGLLKKSAYFFFPSFEEGWGIALAEALYCECRCLCYELPHYRSIFGDFPAYVRLGDAEDFIRVFNQCGPVVPEQKQFLHQYDDPNVAQQLAEHLRSVANR
jgi:glycosyltransferase involved in cell wall biosynthesis